MIYILVLVLFFIAVGFFIGKKKKQAVVQSFPENWRNLLLDNVHFYRNLKPIKQAAFERRLMQFLSEVYIEGVGLEINDLDKLLIACSAVIPVFGFKEWHYYNLSSVLLYPDYFNTDLEFADTAKSRNIGGLVGTGRFENQMILSRRALYHGFANTTDKGNTGIHEFVHLIDKMDGLVDGVPERLLNHQYAMPWLDMIHKKMEAINEDKSDIRKYAGTNQAEFFAVAAEYFFERPDLLKRKHPHLYKMLEVCFNTKGNK
ncbi:zinc-dependent peptidase [Flavobacterium sp. NRK1]|uniref:M90 family metallopeptidase n=1 Tax=Flavobacterium sp. NRK1 TaxID=2954929 RepID=UPI0020932E0E|nr:M90 family metallopeptidase [Flavobacterium sp. NRK1]MCO6149466.1 zinc-dependent peptidase [Flavobacterium sp. NRK1]